MFRILFTNSFIVFITQAWLIFLALFTTPYIINHLGADSYGILSLIIVLTQYLSFIDLGFGWGLVKYIAEFRAKEDQDAILKSFSTTLFIFLGLGFCAFLFVYLSAPWITEKLSNIPPAYLNQTANAIQVSSVAFFLVFVTSVFHSLFRGFQRFSLSSWTQAVFSTLYSLGTVILVYYGKGITEIVWLGLLVNFIALSCYILLVKIYFPQYVCWPSFHKKYFLILCNFSIFSTFSRLGMMGTHYFDKFLISYLLPISALSYYIVSFNLSHKLTFMGYNIAAVVMPLASGTFSLNQFDEFKSVYLKTAKLLWLMTLAPALILVVLSDQILYFWVNPDFGEKGGLALLFLALGFLLMSVSSLEAICIESIGKPHINSIFHLATGCLNLVLAFVLTRKYGITGTAFSLFLSLTILSVCFISFFHRVVLKDASNAYLKKICWPACKMTAISVPLLFITRIFIQNGKSLIILSLCALIMNLVIGSFFFFNGSERRGLLSFLGNYMKNVKEAMRSRQVTREAPSINHWIL